MTQLIACGCSFMTTTYFKYAKIKGINWPEFSSVAQLQDKSIKKELESYGYEHHPHFLDFYVDSKKFDYRNLAMAGASNFVIRVQIDQAIALKPDYVVVAATEAGRFEIPLTEFKYEQLVRNFDQRETEWMMIDDQLGKVDKNYLTSTSAIYFAKLLTLENTKENAIKQYLTELHNYNLAKTKDYYILQSGLDLLEKNNIPYVFIPGPLKDLDWTGRSIVWPADANHPWDTQFGWHEKYNHNPVEAHKEYLETLLEITKGW